MSNLFFRKRSLLLQATIVVSLLISTIEIALFVGSYYQKERELYSLKQGLVKGIENRTELTYEEIFPHYLSEEDIQYKLQSYGRNIFQLVVVIILFVSLGTSYLFYRYVGRHLFTLQKYAQFSDGKNILYYPEKDIPRNDLGDLIINQNAMLKKIEEFQAKGDDTADGPSISTARKSLKELDSALERNDIQAARESLAQAIIALG